MSSPSVEQAERQSSNCAALLYCLERLLEIRETRFEDAIEGALQVVARALGADVVLVYLLDEAQGEFRIAAANDRSVVEQARSLGYETLPLGGGTRPAQVFAGSTPYMTGHAEQDDTIARVVRELGARSILLAPIEAGQETRGVVLAGCREAERFSEEDQSFFLAVSYWMGLMAHRSLLLDRSAR